MKKVFLMGLVLLLFVGTASAAATKQKLTAGWDNFGEPLNFAKSSVKWSLSPKRTLSVTFALVGAHPNKLYQVGLTFFCDSFPATFGQFPTVGGGGPCTPSTKQGVTKNFAAVEIGVVTTDMNGKGSFTVVIGPVLDGTYKVEFFVHDGAGCNLNGGGGTNTCWADFQSPGPFGTATTVVVP